MVNKSRLNFKQRMGLQPLPSQLDSSTISGKFKAKVWVVFENFLQRHSSEGFVDVFVSGRAAAVLKGYFVDEDEFPVDEFEEDFSSCKQYVKNKLFHEDPMEALNFIDYCVAHKSFETTLTNAIANLMEECSLAYRIVNQNEVGLFSGDEHVGAMNEAFDKANSSDFEGVVRHLSKANEALSARHWEDSIRENMQAVESAVRKATGERDFAGALAKIESTRTLHPALKKAFSRLYGYTSDEGGLRHAIVDDPVGIIDEQLALLMSHLCVAFINFVVGMGLPTVSEDSA